MTTEALPTATQPPPAHTRSPHGGWLAEFRIDPRLMRLFVYSGLLNVAAVGIGFALLMHMVPPPSPTWSKMQTLHWVQQHRTSILIGALICTFFWCFFVTWMAPILLYIRRMERTPLLTTAGVLLVAGGGAVITMIAVAWTIMAFRAEDATTVQTFLDLGFFLFLYTWPGFALVMVIIAIAIFQNVHPTPILPRWLAYYNLFAAMAMAPASFMGLFKTGPLAYDGVLSFWLVCIDFFTWMIVMTIVMLKAIRKDEQRLQQI
jgi:hypothetical protein